MDGQSVTAKAELLREPRGVKRLFSHAIVTESAQLYDDSRGTRRGTDQTQTLAVHRVQEEIDQGQGLGL